MYLLCLFFISRKNHIDFVHFIKKKQSALTVHIKRVHKDLDEVEKASTLGVKERRAKFESFKREGIRLANPEEVKKKNPNYERQRESKDGAPPIMCSNCNLTIQRRSAARHFQSCVTSGKLPFKIDIGLLKDPDLEFSNDFKKHILATMKKDEIGLKAKSDHLLLLFASKEFENTLKNPDKVLETRKTVRRNVRELTKLFLTFLKDKKVDKHFNNCKDMFLRQNFDILRSVIKEYGEYEDGTIKSGAKVNIQYTIKNAVRPFIGYSHVSGNSSNVEIFERFLSAFKLYENSLFEDARYAIELSKKKRLKIPQELPLEKDMEMFRDYTVEEIMKVNDDSNYVTIRDAVCAILTLSNARRFVCFKQILYLNFLHLKSSFLIL